MRCAVDASYLKRTLGNCLHSRSLAASACLTIVASGSSRMSMAVTEPGPVPTVCALTDSEATRLMLSTTRPVRYRYMQSSTGLCPHLEKQLFGFTAQSE